MYFDPNTVTLDEVISRTMGCSKDVLYGDNIKAEDHPSSSRRFPESAGFVQVNISSPSSVKGHISFDIPYDRNGRFGKAVRHEG